VPETIMNFSRDSARKVACTTQDDVSHAKVDTAGKDIVLCPENGALTMFAEGGRWLKVDFSPQFKREKEHLLRGRTLGDFIHIYAPMTYPGSIVGSWKIIPVSSRPRENIHSAWDKSGLTEIVLTVRAE
jgi:hypothetical protein